MIFDHQLAALQATVNHKVLKGFIRNAGVTIMSFGKTGLKGVHFIPIVCN
jgi:hypothetical protein